VRDVIAHDHPRFAAILPAGHISHHLINVFSATLLGAEVCYGGGLASLVEDLRAVRPTVVFGSPLLFGEIESEIRSDLGRSRRGRRILARLDARRDRHLEAGEIRRGDVTLLGRLVGRKAARAVGLHRARELMSGTSPLDDHTHAFLAAIGWYVRNTYGLSECGGAATISDRRRMVPGELGRPVEGMRVHQAADGEIVLAGPSLMRGYLGEPERAASDELGTGDLAVRSLGALRFECRASRLIFAGPERVNLDAVERSTAAVLDVDAVVIAPGRSGLEVYVVGDRRPTPADVLAALPDPLRDLVDGVATASGALVDGAGLIGPTGKVRRWRVQEHWRGQLGPVPAPAVAA
jgi:long-chain acyl-CoA synthetase